MVATPDLIPQALAVLRRNDMGDYTRPSPRLYPHQWNWDSAFVALALAHLDWPRMEREVDALLAAQWANGMLPHIHYNPGVSGYFPGPEWWPDVPVRRAGERTSGISHPPVLPTAVYWAGLAQRNAGVRHAWWARIYEALRDALRFFSRDRTVAGSPLIVLVHPWESGLDNAPRWDFATQGGFRPSRAYTRHDTGVVAAAERPRSADYDLYLYLVELIAAHRYELTSFLPHTPFAVYDALFNAIWYRAALDLNRIAAALGRSADVPAEELRAFRDAYRAELWDEPSCLFLDFDVRAGRRIPVHTIAGLGAVFAGVVDVREAKEMYRRYRDRCRGCQPLPTVLPDQPQFEPARYWRGPAWVNTNWFVVRGLEELGLRDDASALADATIDLVRRAGWCEYFHASTGEGLGGGDFSWTAALVVDLLLRKIRASV
ncbi:MAG TPA: trehalase family glycosidase [bacterium]|nr:trehalase family glycosidase [bacterium]